MQTIELKPNTRYRVKIGNDLQTSWCYGRVGSKTVHSEFATSYFFERAETNPKTTRRNYTGEFIWHYKLSDQWGIRGAEEIILMDRVKQLEQAFLHHARNKFCPKI